MKDFVEIQDRLITLENIKEVYINKGSFNKETFLELVIKYKDETYITIDYSDILDDINDERQIDKDYKKLKEALELKPENYEKYQDLFYKIYSLSFKRTFSFIRLRKIQDLILDFLN